MRKERAAARKFLAEIAPERAGVDRHQNQIAPAGKMPGRRLGGLCGCGKVNKAVRDIDGRAGKDPGAFRLIPQRYVADFVDDRQSKPHLSRATVSARSRSFKRPKDMDNPSFYSYKPARIRI